MLFIWSVLEVLRSFLGKKWLSGTWEEKGFIGGWCVCSYFFPAGEQGHALPSPLSHFYWPFEAQSS